MKKISLILFSSLFLFLFNSCFDSGEKSDTPSKPALDSASFADSGNQTIQQDTQQKLNLTDDKAFEELINYVNDPTKSLNGIPCSTICGVSMACNDNTEFVQQTNNKLIKSNDVEFSFYIKKPLTGADSKYVKTEKKGDNEILLVQSWTKAPNTAKVISDGQYVEDNAKKKFYAKYIETDIYSDKVKRWVRLFHKEN